ncbi:class I SAM-dependent methyltransferase [Pseudoduganella sp. LjRoot289]|uniref:class I SAM-dependent methyltransferase n=1 Tax=Pseudoduganella sp. LjRoot289 TaxID=3342314 RepID=UPI003ECF7396
MSDWSAGYVADIGYTFGLYTELNPLRIKLAFLNAGLAFPEVGAACELGFGQGVSVNIHAAASVTEWHGTDFNPAQAAFAQELAVASDAHAQLHDLSFEEFCSRPHLPDFDFICLHGIWSWISDANRAVIVDFVRRKLKPGGVLYISYNTQPGWAAMAPVRDLLTEHSQVMGAPGKGIVPRIDESIAFVEKLFATQPAFLKANPGVSARMERIKDMNRNYVAHEYFNRDWVPMSFAAMAEQLEEAKLSYACSAFYLDHIDSVNFSAEQQALLAEIPDPMFRETVRDFMVNQQFRRDYWVRGARRLSAAAREDLLRKQKLLLAVPRKDVPLKISAPLGEVTLQTAVYAPILDLLADHQPRTIAEIEAACATQNVSIAQIVQAVFVLAGNGNLRAVQDDHAIAGARPQTERLNRHLCQMAVTGSEVSYLASPVTGSGTQLDRFSQLFVLASLQGKQQPAEWAAFAGAILDRQNQRLQKEGVALERDAQSAELRRMADAFAEFTLPILQAQGIVG